MKIGIVGYGYVGQAMYRFFKDHYDMVIYDPFYEPKEDEYLPIMNRKDLFQCDVALVCVPTPMKKGTNFCDVSLVEESVGWIESPLILIKSTVEVGTTERLKRETGKRICFSPEYCGESKYWSPYAFDTDVKETPFFIFGGDKRDTSELVNLYMRVTGPTKIYRQTDAATAEMVKYVENTFYATKIAFCYELAEICKKANIDYNEMRDLWLLDPRLNSMHTAVFKENVNPFGGKCLPKDLMGLIGFAEKMGYDAKLLKEVTKSNKRIGLLREENVLGSSEFEDCS